MKFKIGDRVKCINDGRWDKPIVGKLGTIAVRGDDDGNYGVEFDDYINGHSCGCSCKNGHGWYCTENMLELVTKEKPIMIYRKGREVIAEDKNTGKKGVAKCSPSDEFNFYTGAKLALERLTGDEKKKVKFADGMGIWCENKSQFDELMWILETMGYRWRSGNMPTQYRPSDYIGGMGIFVDNVITFERRESVRVHGSHTYVDFSDVDFLDCVWKIKVGDYVRVTDPRQSYSRYTDFFKEYTEDIPVDVAVRFMYLKQPEKDKRYKVLYLKKHPIGGNDMYVIENADGEVYLIDAKGVEKW